MEWNMSLRQEKTKLVVIFGLLTFGVVFLVTGTVLTAVFGIKPGDWNYGEYPQSDGTPKTSYQNLLTNACLTQIFAEGDQTVILDTKGLKEIGFEYIGTNPCLDMALGMTGYEIDKIETYGDDQMKITMVKKP